MEYLFKLYKLWRIENLKIKNWRFGTHPDFDYDSDSFMYDSTEEFNESDLIDSNSEV